MTDKIKEVTELATVIKQASKQLENAISEALAEAAKRLLDKSPEIEYLYWPQFTPFFNDGESCTFSVHEVEFKLRADYDDYFDTGEGSYLYSYNDYVRAKDALQEVTEYINNNAAWRAKAEVDYRRLYKRALPVHYAPYPRTIEEAEEEVKRIELQRNLISQEDADRILNSVDEFSAFLQLIPDSILQIAFGDHVKVIISREGVTVEEYTHD
jgi:hypothetical protein